MLHGDTLIKRARRGEPLRGPVALKSRLPMAQMKCYLSAIIDCDGTLFGAGDYETDEDERTSTVSPKP